MTYARGDRDVQIPLEGCTDGRSRTQRGGPTNRTTSHVNVDADTSISRPVPHSRVVEQHRELFQAINQANQNRFQCLYCGNSYLRRICLNAHIRTCRQRLLVNPVDVDDKLLQCEHCGVVTSSKSILRAHMQKHIPFKAHKCQLCGKAYQYKSSLATHITRHHSKREAAKPTGDCDEAKKGVK
ncbi:zinc finger protein Gfi-1 [Clonorchis sinensis]|uniref:Zinc finger protein Gfi-1 n=1 Tax=Clonorchis sinensis TaxID=79923 RepID=G7YC20_CLOSI|nr:zinc finger protein Gfi-1 [Clonorchis sinensis]